MTSGFEADLSTGDGFVVVALSGELDLAEAAGLRKTLDRVIRSGAQLVIADASDLTFLDSSGIGVLVAAHNAQESLGGLFAIANLSEQAGRPIRLTEVDTAVPVHWADPVVRPWTETDATAASILTTLGFEAKATLAEAFDRDAIA